MSARSTGFPENSDVQFQPQLHIYPSPCQGSKLNSDILLEVFRWLLHDCKICTNDIRNLHAAPFNIACVCRSWREIVLAHGSLWSSISLAHSRKKRFYLPMLKYIINRSKEVPLVMDVALERSSQPSREVIAILRAMNDSDCCTSFSLTVSTKFNPFRYTFPQTYTRWEAWEKLNILKLHFPSWDGATFELDISKALYLRVLDLRVPPDVRIVCKGTFFANLTTIDLQPDGRFGHSIDLCMKLLETAPTLKSFRAAIDVGDSTYPRRMPQMRLHLEELEELELLSHPHPPDVPLQHIFAKLNMPKLTQLSFGIYNPITPSFLDNDGDSIHTVQLRNIPWARLERLSFRAVHVRNLRLALAAADRLRSFVYTGCMHLADQALERETKRIIRMLTLPSLENEHSSKRPCPFLKTITFIDCDLTDRSSDVTRMILSRWNFLDLTRSLKKITFRCCDLDKLLEEPEIERCVTEGLCIAVESSTKV